MAGGEEQRNGPAADDARGAGDENAHKILRNEYEEGDGLDRAV
jgi:hypothetical protein